MNLAIVIVSFNCRNALRQCLRSLPAFPVVVIDNASNDATPAMVRDEFPRVTLITNTGNRGFAVAANQGIRVTTEPFVLLLNPDTVVTTGALQRLVDAMEAGIGACGPRLQNPDSSRQPSCRRFPTLWRMGLAELGVRGLYHVANPGRDVDQLLGACLLLRRAALDQVGLLDEQFFLYFEEVDLCLRLKHAGWGIIFVPDATVMHTGGQSSRTARPAALQHRYRSLFAFYRKHYPRWQLPVLKGAVQLGAVVRWIAGQREYETVATRVWKL